MDLSCEYSRMENEEVYCTSPKVGDRKILCCCSNHKECILYPKDKKDGGEFLEEGGLEINLKGD